MIRKSKPAKQTSILYFTLGCALILLCVLLPWFASSAMALESENPEFSISFLDVGEGDSIFVCCDGHSMLIDGGEFSSSSYLYSFLKSRQVTHLDYIIATHPDADHVGGLSGALQYADAGTAYSTVTSCPTETFSDFVRKLQDRGLTLQVPQNGESFALGSAAITILYPENWTTLSGNLSLVLKIQYGNTSFLLMGDAPSYEEEDLISSGADLQSNLLKLGHHGASTSTTQNLLNAVQPEIAVISVGKNSYGHPADDVLARLEKAGVTLYRTDQNGIITCVSDGNSISVTTEKDNNVVSRSAVQTPLPTLVPKSEPGAVRSYIVNINTGKFHYPDCRSVKKMKESNKWYYEGTRDNLISQGYSPCGNCHP